MKMSEKMFGLPGKCVACRQKIRIPRSDELPEGTDTVYLKDHPQFLRKADTPKSGSDIGSSNKVELRRGGETDVALEEDIASVAVVDEPDEAVALDAEGKSVSTVPLETLEPLRNICSVQYKLAKQYKALDKKSAKDSGTRAELKGRLLRVQAIRDDLDEQLRQVLMEVAIELASTDEKIVQTGLGARVGEIGFDEYRETIERLRRRRDRLERRQQNLRGWLATTDPHRAGGYIDLPFDSLPEDGFNVTLPVDADESTALIHVHINHLKSAFLERSHAERKLAEMDRMAGSSTRRKSGFSEARADAKAEARIASEAIEFSRSRLKQLEQDYEEDGETFESELELTRGRLQVGEIDRSKYDAIESVIQRAKMDSAKARSLIRRTLNANSVQDVPQPRGTFLSRLRAEKPESAVGIDPWIAWGAAIFMGVSIFLPAVSKFSLVQCYLEFDYVEGLVRWAFLGPVVYAVVVAIAAGFDGVALRGRLLLLVWLIGTAVGALAIHQTNFSLDPISSLFRSEELWFMQPGIFVLLAGHFAVLVAAGLCLLNLEQERMLLAAGAAAGAVFVAAAFSDFFGLLVASPSVTVSGDTTPDEAGTATRTVTVINSGRRTAHLVYSPSTSQSAYLFAVERQVGPTSWSDVPIGGEGELSGGAFSSRGASGVRAAYEVAPGDSIDAMVDLEPGNYRVLLQPGDTGEDIQVLFSVGAPVRRDAAPAASEIPSVNSEGPGTETPVLPDLPEPVMTYERPTAIKLTGVLTGEGREPRFSFEMTYGDGAEDRSTVAIGEAVFGPWNLIEYNPELRTVTLSNESEIFVVRTGEGTPFPE